HLRPSSEVAQILTEGLVRSSGRHYIFERWKEVQLLLNALHRTPSSAADPFVVLVIDADSDMLVETPVPERRLPSSLRPEDVKELQAHSRYAEVDISSHRIRDVKNGFGDSVLSLYQSRQNRRAPVWRFLAYVKPYWGYVAIATT